MDIKLDKNAYMPTKGHVWDAGWDLYSTEDIEIPPRSTYTFNTGVHIAIPTGYVGFVKSRSGLMRRNGIITDGTIDSGYTGAIGVCLFNTSGKPIAIEEGDRIAQLVIVPFLDEGLTVVDELEKTERGNNGFGSTGK